LTAAVPVILVVTVASVVVALLIVAIVAVVTAILLVAVVVVAIFERNDRTASEEDGKDRKEGNVFHGVSSFETDRVNGGEGSAYD
jgi:hypothetical protein